MTRLLLEKHGRTWDDVPLPGVAIGDLDSHTFAEFRQRGVASDRLPRSILQESDAAVIDRAMELLYSKYTRALISYDGIYRVETAPVPRNAMREAVTNAVMHRDYASPTSTQIRVPDDRISIGNAARLPSDWTAPSDRAPCSRGPAILRSLTRSSARA
ncbi:MAG: hypothetical protein OXK77_05785 [Gemmatimonadota bacterium]|nr:hypothetical protein [Gemmatimonadota bacterium]MDE2866048.1 hypothetical protein [Gemmatimonadota bacterium]